MLFEPQCFVRFIESNNVPLVEYIDNWADGEQAKYFFLSDELVLDMTVCIDKKVAVMYLKRIDASFLVDQLDNLDCPCNNYSS